MWFKKKKLYEIVYKLYTTNTMLIEAKDEFQALKKFDKKIIAKYGIFPTVISLEEIC